jgi:hypothetical protein
VEPVFLYVGLEATVKSFSLTFYQDVGNHRDLNLGLGVEIGLGLHHENYKKSMLA